MNIFELAKNPIFELPVDRGDYDYLDHLKSLLKKYKETYFDINNCDINNVCEKIVASVEEYLNGKPAKAFNIFYEMFDDLFDKHYIHIYEKDMISDSLPFLYRVRKKDKYTKFSRQEMFHVPFNKRNLCNTSRYSIAGFPSLYMSTSLQLCCNELRVKDKTILCGTVLNQIKSEDMVSLVVLELSIKPKDFLLSDRTSSVFDRYNHHRKWNPMLINSTMYQNEYFYWYPVIAACSYIKKDVNGFAPEYIIPQLLMQCIREKQGENKIYGIRYFPCSSKESADLGINYVFPTSNIPNSNNSQYCKMLSKILQLKEPVIFRSGDNLKNVEKSLIRNGEFLFV